MKTFAERLAICLRKGQMVQGDLRWWFGRSYATTGAWLKGSRSPGEERRRAGHDEAWRRLELLEMAIARKKGFPVPHDLSLTERPHHIEKLYHDNCARIPRKNTARGRLQMRNGL
jgi:hypothetical protein